MESADIPRFPYNKRIIFFDTETSGLNPEVHEILQLSYFVVDGATWEVLKKKDFYFPYPEDECRVSRRAIEINHLTKEFLSRRTISTRYDGLSQFYADLYTCQMAVAHNIRFDYDFIEHTASVEKVPRHAWPFMYCTMMETINVCQIEDSRRWGYKYPRLEELAKFLHINYNKDSLHDSFTDTALTLECFKRLHANNQLSACAYINYKKLDKPIENAEFLFPHQDPIRYLGKDAPPIIIHDELLATYNFYSKRVAYTLTEDIVKKTGLIWKLRDLGAHPTPNLINHSNIISDAIIISQEISPGNKKIFQQLSEFQRMNSHFPVFTFGAFLQYSNAFKKRLK